MPTPENLEEGLKLLHAALEIDPDFIQAKAQLCFAHTGALATRWWTLEQASTVLPLAWEVLDSGTEDPLALAQVGHHIAYIGKDFATGRATLERAHQLNPNSATIVLLLGWSYVYENNNAEAIRHLERAIRMSPLHPQIGVTHCGIGNANLQLGNLEEAIAAYEKALSQYPEFYSIHLGLMGAYHAAGRSEDSTRIAALYRAKVPEMSIAVYKRTSPQSSSTYGDHVMEALRANGFPED